MAVYTPTTVDGLVEAVTEAACTRPGPVLVAVEGADAAEPREPADRIVESLRARGRPAARIWLHDYIRPASLRLEFGRDATTYRTAWYDYAALDREVVQALRRHRRWLPALRYETGDRSARVAVRTADPGTVLVIAGPMLLGRNLDFDVTLRLQMSEAALRRRTDPAEHWTIPALLHHDAEAAEAPTFEARWDHPDRPALRTSR